MASLNHPNIAAIYGLENHEDLRFLVLELVPGDALAERIARGPIPVGDAVPLIIQVAEALEAAHEAGVIHRDLKPPNIKVVTKVTMRFEQEVELATRSRGEVDHLDRWWAGASMGPNGRELFYRNDDKMLVVDVITDPDFIAGAPRLLFQGRYDLSPDGDQHYDRSRDGKRFVMVSLGEEPLPRELRVVLNWAEELKRTVPTK